MKKALEWFNKPETLVWIHGCFIIFWIMVWIAAAVFGWLTNVAFVSHLSVIALILASWASWQGARSERRVKQDEENKEK